VRTRGLFTLVVLAIGGALPAIAGCAPPQRGTTVRFVDAAASGRAAAPVPTTTAPVPVPSGPSSPAKAPAHRSPTPGSRALPDVPWCQASDVGFAIDAATGGDTYQWFGSVMVTDVSGRTCAMSNYLILQWRDAHGVALPVTVTRIAGPVPPGLFFVIRPGTRGIAGIYWQKYTAFNSTETCLPFATALDIWLGATLQDPHPEQRPPAQVAWFTGTTASICGGTVKLEPLDRMP
jgi:hypothetical protein